METNVSLQQKREFLLRQVNRLDQQVTSQRERVRDAAQFCAKCEEALEVAHEYQDSSTAYYREKHNEHMSAKFKLAEIEEEIRMQQIVGA